MALEPDHVKLGRINRSALLNHSDTLERFTLLFQLKVSSLRQLLSLPGSYLIGGITIISWMGIA